MGLERGGGEIPVQEMISKDEVKTAISRLTWKALGLDRITIEVLKSDGDIMAE